MIDSYPLGDITAEQFLSEYWQKKPLLIRNAFPDFEPPVSADELAGLACEADVESRLIIQNPSNDEWSLENGPFDEERFASLPKTHWTLLVQAVDHWVPEAKALLDQFRFIPSWRIDDLMISYAPKGGGVGPHFDNYDVFLLQAEGQRRWEVGGQYHEGSPRRNDAPVMILPEWDAEESFILNPGDMLYVPPQLGHNGIAETDNCITYSVGFRAPSHAEILRNFTDFVGEQVTNEMRYADTDIKLQDSPSLIDNDAFNKVRDIFESYLKEPGLLEDWFGQYMTEPKYPELMQPDDEAEPISPKELQEYLDNGGLLFRAEGSRFAYRQKQVKNYVLFVNGVSCEVHAHEGDFVRAICDNEAIGSDFIKSTETLEIAAELLNMEALRTELDDEVEEV
jgi:50S ribosomal protein L16 3-hydroxylase